MDAIRQYLSEIGARGGRSKSVAKVEASRRNAAIATEARIKNRQKTDSKKV